MSEIVLHNSSISGLHATKTSSHPDITLLIGPDITHKDPNAMKVVVPMLQNLPPESLDMVTWPKNPERKRFVDQVVRDVAGKKVGNVPANLCAVFKDLLREGVATGITARSTTDKPRASTRPHTKQSFQRRVNGLDRRGGGVVLDCLYTISVTSSGRLSAVRRLEDALKKIGGDERLECLEHLEDGEVELIQTHHPQNDAEVAGTSSGAPQKQEQQQQQQQPGLQQRKTGKRPVYSIVNPWPIKRKKATGVIFDSDL